MSTPDYRDSRMIGGSGGGEFSDLYLIQERHVNNITAIAIGTGGEEGIDALMVRQWLETTPVACP